MSLPTPHPKRPSVKPEARVSGLMVVFGARKFGCLARVRVRV